MGKSYDKNIEKAKKFVVVSLVLSLFAHLVVLGGNWMGNSSTTEVAEDSRKQEQKLKVLLKQYSKPKQIVTSEESEVKQRSEKAKYLSKTTQTFLRETSARNVGAFKKAGEGSKQGIKQPVKAEKNPQKIVKKSEAKKHDKKVAATNSKKVSKFKKKVSFSDLAAAKPQLHEVVQKKVAPSLSALGLKNGKAKEAGLSANNDFVEEVPLGDMTRLNTVEYKYYGFYHRIKQKLEQYWGNSIQKKAHALWKSGRRMPASENRITSLEVTLDQQGKIVNVNVKGSSGVRELDDAAIESFNKAGPFPNPPKGMVKNGHARIQWGFVVKS